jgi:hypothetical protein
MRTRAKLTHSAAFERLAGVAGAEVFPIHVPPGIASPETV